MRRRPPTPSPLCLAAIAVLVALLAAACSGGSSGGTPSGSPALVSIGAGLQGPSGTSASVYATGVANASALVFDTQGRLWVATAAFNDDDTDAIYVIDSKGATPRKVASAHTPLGVLWIGNELYVSEKESVVVESGFDGTAFASNRVVLQLPTGVGEVNGMALGADGRIHLGITSPCDSCTPSDPLSAAVVSFKPDGTDLKVESAGIRAPISLAFRASTGALYVTMNQRDDLGDKTPGDWLAVVADGQNWGFPACYGQGGTACTGAPSPVAELDKHAAVSGLVLLTDQLGSANADVALVAEWSKGVVLAVHLDAEDGKSTRVETFLSGLKSPEPLATTSGGVVVGDWATGTIYLVTAAANS